jgi:hypothetical protein
MTLIKLSINWKVSKNLIKWWNIKLSLLKLLINWKNTISIKWILVKRLPVLLEEAFQQHFGKVFASTKIHLEIRVYRNDNKIQNELFLSFNKSLKLFVSSVWSWFHPNQKLFETNLSSIQFVSFFSISNSRIFFPVEIAV